MWKTFEKLKFVLEDDYQKIGEVLELCFLSSFFVTKKSSGSSKNLIVLRFLDFSTLSSR